MSSTGLTCASTGGCTRWHGRVQPSGLWANVAFGSDWLNNVAWIV